MSGITDFRGTLDAVHNNFDGGTSNSGDLDK